MKQSLKAMDQEADPRQLVTDPSGSDWQLVSRRQRKAHKDNANSPNQDLQLAPHEDSSALQSWGEVTEVGASLVSTKVPTLSEEEKFDNGLTREEPKDPMSAVVVYKEQPYGGQANNDIRPDSAMGQEKWGNPGEIKTPSIALQHPKLKLQNEQMDGVINRRKGKKKTKKRGAKQSSELNCVEALVEKPHNNALLASQESDSIGATYPEMEICLKSIDAVPLSALGNTPHGAQPIAAPGTTFKVLDTQKEIVSNLKGISKDDCATTKNHRSRKVSFNETGCACFSSFSSSLS